MLLMGATGGGCALDGATGGGCALDGGHWRWLCS